MGRWHYPRWRRILMQVTLCAIFAGSVGLAALATRNRNSQSSTRLAGIRWIDRVGIKAPAGWSLEAENQGAILLIAQEPDVLGPTERDGRKLTVRRAQLNAAIPPVEYLNASGLLRGTHPVTGENIGPEVLQTLPIAKTNGIAKLVLRAHGLALFAPPVYVMEWIACAVRPDGLAITIQLECPDNTDPEGDQLLLRDIASEMEVRDAQAKNQPSVETNAGDARLTRG